MGLYYDVLYKLDWLTFLLPAAIAMVLFWVIYSVRYKKHTWRVRTQIMVRM